MTKQNKNQRNLKGQYALNSGFTLIELMITIMVAAILLGVATPSFQTLIANNRVTKISNEYATAFRLARTTSLSKGLVTFVCPSANANNANPTCGGSWTDGLLVFSKPPITQVNNPGTFQNGDTLLLQSSFGNTLSTNVTSSTAAGQGKFIGFLNDGSTWQTAPSLVLCDSKQKTNRGNAFLFSAAGRMTVRATIASDNCGN